MVKQDVIQMCRLDKKEFDDMVNSVLETICMGKTLRSRTCNIILGLDEHKPRYFTRCVMGNADSIFLSQSFLYPFNPLYSAFMQNYPNDVKKYLMDDMECCFSEVLIRLLQSGFDITVQDNLEDYNHVFALIELISYYGYDIRIIVNKKRMYEERLKMIKELVIKAIFEQMPLKINERDFVVSDFMKMLKKNEISELIIYDNFLVFDFQKNEGRITAEIGFNSFGLDNDRHFERLLKELQSFISTYRCYLSEENLALVTVLVQNCIQDFYERIDFTLLSGDLRAR